VKNCQVAVDYSFYQEIKRKGLEGKDPSKVIVLTMLDIKCSIALEFLKEICSEWGKVNRIALVKHPTILQALVEFDTVEEAAKAKYGLNGIDISGACIFKAEYSKVSIAFISYSRYAFQKLAVDIHMNNADQWDYSHDIGLSLDLLLDLLAVMVYCLT